MLIVGPNLTIDRTAALAELRPGEVLRAERVVVTPGGKGVNVARAARSLGAFAELVGFVPGELGRAAAAMLRGEGISLRGVPCAGELRSTAIVIEDGGRTTVLNEPGPSVTRAEWEALEAVIAEALPGHAVLVCAGSVPPGSPDDAYARLVRLASRAGLRCVVDASGATLAHALPAGPDVICPNLAEAEQALGRDGGPAGADHAGEPVEAVAGAQSRALAAAGLLVARGAGAAVVTTAAAGAALAAGSAAPVWFAAPRATRVRNPIGAGDTLTGALAVGLERSAQLLDAARAAVAAATASVESPTAGELDAARAAGLLTAVVAEPA
jgi:1-phosphofructokinase family hexose kinase